MDKERLEQLRALQIEIKHRTEEVEYLKSRHGEPVGDTVKDYSTGYGRVVVIRGYSNERLERKIKALEKKTKKLEEELEELEAWIEAIPDSELRLIFDLRYKDGASWDEIASRMYMHRTTVKRKHDNYLL